MAPIDEEKLLAALKKLDAALAADGTGDHSWFDELPEGEGLPEGADETQALIIPKRTR